MAYCCNRLLAPKQFSLTSRIFRNVFTAPRQLVSMKVMPFKPAPQEGHDEKNMRLNRPLSPHLTIYSFQLTAVLSISHRITGLTLSAYVAGLGLGALLLPQSIPAYLAAANLSAGSLFVGKFLLAFPFAYHLVNGIRHLVWDLGKALSIKEVYATGYTMLGIATALTLILLSL